MIYPKDGQVLKGDEVLVDSRTPGRPRIWKKAKETLGGAVGDLVAWWGIGNVRRSKKNA